MMFYLILLLFATIVKGNHDIHTNVPESRVSEGDNEQDESYGSPVYGPPYRLGGMFPYNYPVPPTAPYPANYATYFSGLALNSPYAYGPYGRYNYLPYSSQPALRYTVALQNGLRYGFQSGLGYPGISSPYVDRVSYSALGGLAYPPYASNLVYPYGGYGYPPTPVRPAAVARAPVPGFPVRYSLPAASAPVPAKTVLPPTTAYSPPSVPIPAPPVFQPAVPYTPNVPAPLPPAPYRPDARPVKGTDEPVRYTYREQ